MNLTIKCYQTNVQKELVPVAHSHWGNWGSPSFCPENTWAAGFGLKVEFDQGSVVDDSALNGVRLLCYDGNGTQYVSQISSSVGGLGSWGSNIFCFGNNNFLNGIRLRSEDVRRSFKRLQNKLLNCRALDLVTRT